MRTVTTNFVRLRARRVQDLAFVAGLLGSVAFIGFAITNREGAAMSCALLACFAYGVSAGAWTLASRFKD